MNSGFEQGDLPWKAAKISRPKDNDLSKQWCVVYGIWSFDKNTIIRKRIILKGDTVEARLEDAKSVMQELKPLLDGKHFVGRKPKDFKPQVIAKLKVDVEPVISPSLPIHQAVDIYIRFTAKAHSTNTLKSYRTAVMALLEYLERTDRPNLRLGEFSDIDAREFLTELITIKGLSNRTRNNTKGFVCTFFNYFIDLDRTRKLKKLGNPFEDISKLPQVQNKHQSYSTIQQKEYRELCEQTDQHYLLTFCRWMYYTLMRPHEELRRLRVRDVRTKIIYVTGNSAKTNEGEYVDIPLPLELLIQEQKIRDYPGHYYVFSAGGQPGPTMVGNKYFYRRHIKVLEKMNLVGSGHDMYSWKHTGAIALWNATKDIDLIRQQARHSDIKQTIEYLRDLGIRLADDDKIHRFPTF
ncbi:tyrosine-type recombinase/integrase [Spirosoma endbachense]|nr:tyrosine-type recombinase/integrase [Spirosoma endbachense]